MRQESCEKIAKGAVGRGVSLLLLVLLAISVVGTASAETLDDFARDEGLVHLGEFHRTIIEIRDEDRLPPDLYVTKRQAFALGWHRGADLCPWLDHQMIGGDPFDNREGALPIGVSYREADLDEEDCGHRGAKRLVFDHHGDIWITIDHYQSFQQVP